MEVHLADTRRAAQQPHRLWSGNRNKDSDLCLPRCHSSLSHTRQWPQRERDPQCITRTIPTGCLGSSQDWANLRLASLSPKAAVPIRTCNRASPVPDTVALASGKAWANPTKSTACRHGSAQWRKECMKADTPSQRRSLGKQDDLHRLTALLNFRPNIDVTMDAFTVILLTTVWNLSPSWNFFHRDVLCKHFL